jgi:hypothetical protein
MAWSASKIKAVLLDFLERAGWSAGQVFFATLLAGGTTVANLPWKYSSTLAISAGVSSMILTAIQYLTRTTDLSFWPDLLVRLGKTFLSSLAGSIVATGVFDITKFNWTTALNIAILATLSALGKGLLARGQAAFVPKQQPPAGGAAGAAPVEKATPSTLPTGTYEHAVRR